MTLVNLTGLEASVGTPTVLTGTVKVQRWAGGAPAVTLQGEKVIFSPDVTIALIGGEPSVPLALEPTTDEWHYRITVADSLSPRALTVDVAVPDQTSIDFDDLPRVDPSSGLPLVPGTQGVGGLPGLHEVTVSGVTSLAVLHEHTYEVTATSSAAVTLTAVPGTHAAIFWHGVSGTVEGIPMVADTIAVAVLTAAGWRIFVVGAAAADTTPPTAGTLNVVTSYTTADLSVTGAMDDVALHATPFAFSKDNGATWSAWQAAATYSYTGLAVTTLFTFLHKVRDAAGNVKAGTAVVKSTGTPPTWVTWASDGFTGADAALNGRATPAGAKTWTTNVASLTHGETAAIVSNKLSIAGSNYEAATATLPYPPLSAGEAHVRITFDYDLTADTTRARIASYIDTNNVGQPGIAIISAGAAVMWSCGTNDTWNAPAATGTCPTSGTVVAEYWRKSTGELLYVTSINGATVLTVTGTAVDFRGQPGSSQGIGVQSIPADAPTGIAALVDNVQVEYSS